MADKYFVAPWGSDSVTQTQAKNPLTPALTVRYLLSTISAGAGFTDGDVVCIAGQIRPTQAAPLGGYAFINMIANRVAITIRPWLAADGTPATPTTNRLIPPFLRGDAPFDSSWTNVGAGIHTRTFALPSGVTKLVGMTFKWGLVTDRFNRCQAHLRCVSTAAECVSGTNTFHRDTSTGLITIAITDRTGAAYTTNLASGDISFMVEGTYNNAGICLQNSTGCVIEGIRFANFLSDLGTYGASTEHGINNTIRNCVFLDGSSHHGFGHTGDNTVGKVTNGNTFDNCQVLGGMYGSGGGAATYSVERIARPFSLFGREVRNNTVSNCYAQAMPVLTPSGTETYPGATNSGGFGPISCVASIADGGSNNLVTNTTFVGYDQATNGSPGGIEIGGMGLPSEDNTRNRVAYGLRFEHVTIKDMYTIAMKHNGSLSSSVAFFECNISGISFEGRSGGSTSWPGGIIVRGVAGQVGKFLFQRCYIPATLTHQTPGTTTFLFQLNADADLIIDDCVTLDIGSGTRTTGICFPISASNNKFRIYGGIVGSVHTHTSMGLLVADSSFPDASIVAQGVVYSAIADNLYSALASRNTSTEWFATFDPTGVIVDNPYEYIKAWSVGKIIGSNVQPLGIAGSVQAGASKLGGSLGVGIAIGMLVNQE